MCNTASESLLKLFKIYFTDYVDNLMDLIFEKIVMDPTPYMDDILKISIPEDLTSQFEKPDKLEVIARYVSRFNQGQV